MLKILEKKFAGITFNRDSWVFGSIVNGLQARLGRNLNFSQYESFCDRSFFWGSYEFEQLRTSQRGVEIISLKSVHSIWPRSLLAQNARALFRTFFFLGPISGSDNTPFFFRITEQVNKWTSATPTRAISIKTINFRVWAPRKVISLRKTLVKLISNNFPICVNSDNQSGSSILWEFLWSQNVYTYVSLINQSF